MEFEQSKSRVFIAAMVVAYAGILPSIVFAHSDTVAFVSIAAVLISFGYAIWMLAFAEKKKIKIEGLDLEFYDAGGCKHHFDFLKTDIKNMNGLNRTIELKEDERKIRITWLDFGHEAIDRILEYKNHSNQS